MMDIHCIFDWCMKVPASSHRTPIVLSTNDYICMSTGVWRQSSSSNTADKLSHLTTTRTYDYYC